MSDAYIMPDGGPDKKQLQEVLVPSASTVTLNTALITLAFCITIVPRNLYIDYKIHVSFVFLEITTVLEHSGHLIHFSVSLKMKHLPALNRLLSAPYREAQRPASPHQCSAHGIPCTRELPSPLRLQIQILCTFTNLIPNLPLIESQNSRWIS